MIIKKKIDLFEYVVLIEHDDSGNGYIKVTVLDELGDEIENIEIINDNEDEINPSLN